MALSPTFVPVVFAQDDRSEDEHFEEAYSYINNNRQGERLSISFPQGKTDIAKSTELTLSEERFFNHIISKYDRRITAVITGMGLGTTGLKLVPDDRSQISDFISCLEKFIEIKDDFRIHEDIIREKTEDWMGESWNTLNTGRPIGEVYLYPSKKSLSAEFQWDFELNRVWLSIGSRIMIESETVPYILYMCENIESYLDQFQEFRNAVDEKNRDIDTLLGVDE